ncbi:MAG: hypothetical protein KME07_09135 [Pegethrix bostrychoides GSE-TBD4-15B]|uniref:Lipoprotein n=1 Tax=Pegethrix bostrychoides GSE-TBD4-15B TaxID=2839662 RepID=A0A951PA48_9CYAN|nr:hypothetical protein [Pegethrix bostrychoides GSE-TBD4-15B]
MHLPFFNVRSFVIISVATLSALSLSGCGREVQPIRFVSPIQLEHYQR